MRGTGRAAIDPDFRVGHVRRIIGREVEDRLLVPEGTPMGFRGSTLSETQIGQPGMAIWATTKRPAI